MLINNGPAIESALDPERQSDRSDGQFLLPEDIDTLYRNYIPHWGAIWVAGKHIHAAAGDHRFSIEIPGTYTVESDIGIRIDGVEYSNGDTVNLDRGVHSIRTDIPTELTLRWGRGIHRPSDNPPENPIYKAF